jgi:hypothetical protein
MDLRTVLLSGVAGGLIGAIVSSLVNQLGLRWEHSRLKERTRLEVQQRHKDERTERLRASFRDVVEAVANFQGTAWAMQWQDARTPGTEMAALVEKRRGEALTALRRVHADLSLDSDGKRVLDALDRVLKDLDQYGLQLRLQADIPPGQGRVEWSEKVEDSRRALETALAKIVDESRQILDGLAEPVIEATRK